MTEKKSGKDHNDSSSKTVKKTAKKPIKKTRHLIASPQAGNSKNSKSILTGTPTGINMDSEEHSIVSQPGESEDIAVLREKLLQADKELLEALNKKVDLELKCFSQQAPIAPYGTGPERTLPGSPQMGTRYTDWNLDHQRIETIALFNRSKHGAASENCVKTVFREILGEIRRQHHTTRVSYLGPTFSFTHLAAMRYFGTSAELVPVSSIAGIFEETQSRQCDFGIVPIENSTDGRIIDTLEMFTKTQVKISGEVQMPIHHCLIGNLSREKIQKIYSKPQAISQCRDWLSKHLSGVELCESNSTAQAVQMAGESPQSGIAAIASAEAAKMYEVDILAENIEDNPGNKTRFVVLGKEYYPRKGKDKTAVLFQLHHVTGSLAEALSIFKRNHLNLTWIESFPVRNSENEYLFFVEMDGHIRDLKIRRALDGLSKRTIRIDILGSYPAAQ